MELIEGHYFPWLHLLLLADCCSLAEMLKDNVVENEFALNLERIVYNKAQLHLQTKKTHNDKFLLTIVLLQVVFPWIFLKKIISQTILFDKIILAK